MKIAIVGARESKWNEEQIPKVKNKIYECFRRMAGKLEYLGREGEEIILISGHCHKGGVDIWAEEIADKLGLEKEIYSAPAKQWNDKIIHQGVFTPKHLQTKGMFTVGVAPIKKLGYRSRNIQIAEACDILYDIEPAGSCKCKDKKIYVKILGHNFDTQIREYSCSKCGGDVASGGGTWTLKHAIKLGRETYKIVIK